MVKETSPESSEESARELLKIQNLKEHDEYVKEQAEKRREEEQEATERSKMDFDRQQRMNKAIQGESEAVYAQPEISLADDKAPEARFAAQFSDDAIDEIARINGLPAKDRAQAVADLMKTNPKVSNEFRELGGIAKGGKGLTLYDTNLGDISIHYEDEEK